VLLSKGDWLVVFSDGVSEALSAADEEYGDGRIVEVVRKNTEVQPQQMLEALFSDVRTFAKGAAQSDDITALVLRYGS
jgi:sigma-B regulation protein RsbU (phosphoserine phosphatase)